MSISRVMPYMQPALGRIAPRFGNEMPPADADPAQPQSGPVDHKAGQRKPIDVLGQLAKLAAMRTNAFNAEFKQVLDEAKAYLQVLVENKQAAKSAVVLDLDETLLDNSGLELMKIQRAIAGDTKNHWKTYVEWVEQAAAPAIPEALAFVNWLKDNKFPIYFVSARKEYFRPFTVENLRKIGLEPGDYADLYLKKNDDKGTANAFKIKSQHDIESRGHKVAAMIGDQDSDIAGALGRGFKLPNPLYNVH